jgi:hypothetical protein
VEASLDAVRSGIPFLGSEGAVGTAKGEELRERKRALDFFIPALGSF